jgi:polysaccharide export outer membrane protein
MQQKTLFFNVAYTLPLVLAVGALAADTVTPEGTTPTPAAKATPAKTTPAKETPAEGLLPVGPTDVQVRDAMGKIYGVDTQYRIRPGDVLQITVWKEPDASVPDAAVRPDGKITVPLAKELWVDGLTPGEIEKLITDKLSPFIRDVDVSVIVKQAHGWQIYMVGAVKREGPIPLLLPMTVMQAISEAGGFTDFAKTKRVYILRNVSGHQSRLPFNYAAFVNGSNLEQNVQVLPNDMIVVPK